MVGSRRCHFESTPGITLAGNIRHVRVGPPVLSAIAGVFRVLRFEVECQFLRVRPRIQSQPGKGAVSPDVGARHQRSFREVRLRHHDVGIACLYGRHNGRENAPDRAQPAVQPQFGDEDRIAGGFDVVRGAEHGHGHCQVEARAAFGK